MHHLSRNELALHCRRTTCNAREIEELIAVLIRLYDGEVGWDSSGVPLFSSNTMAEVWDSQKKHLPCIVDPLGVLYEQTGTLVKGGHLLPNYKCVRRSTSIESFHQHLNQLIPGVPTCSTLLQIDCWMDGLVRWNEATATASEGLQTPQTCMGVLQQAVNQLREENSFSCELIGLEYLYQQTVNAIQDSSFIIRQMETTDVQVAGSECCCKQEDIGDWTIAQQPVPSLLEASPSMISRGAQFQVEDLFPPITSSPAKEMTAPEKVPSIKEEDSMEYSCDDKPLISNSPPDTVTENNTTQHKKNPQQNNLLLLKPSQAQH